MKCSKCGDPIPDEDKLCAYCDPDAFDLGDEEEEILEE